MNADFEISCLKFNINDRLNEFKMAGAHRGVQKYSLVLLCAVIYQGLRLRLRDINFSRVIIVSCVLQLVFSTPFKTVFVPLCIVKLLYVSFKR